jgi:hypothetical protein
MTQLHSRASMSPAFAVLLDVSSWLDNTGVQSNWDSAAASLQTAGWTVARASRGDHTAAVWAALVGQRTNGSRLGDVLSGSAYAQPEIPRSPISPALEVRP